MTLSKWHHNYYSAFRTKLKPDLLLLMMMSKIFTLQNKNLTIKCMNASGIKSNLHLSNLSFLIPRQINSKLMTQYFLFHILYYSHITLSIKQSNVKVSNFYIVRYKRLIMKNKLILKTKKLDQKQQADSKSCEKFE